MKIKIDIKKNTPIKKSLTFDFCEKVDISKIITLIGVNGVGMTTLCAKLARYYKNKNLNQKNKKSVLVISSFSTAKKTKNNVYSR